MYERKTAEADLPAERQMPDLPHFTNIGLDYFRPTEVKRARKDIMSYLLACSAELCTKRWLTHLTLVLVGL